MVSQANRETIMVIDDTPANLTLLQEMLQSSGYQVVAFPKGELALKAAARRPPSLILLDINMPGIDGYEVCRRLKLNDQLKDIPVVFISAYGETEQKLQAFTVGGVDYITKPFQFGEVHARVKTHLHLRRLQVELEERVQEKVDELSRAHLASILALSKLTESRDYETGKHSERVQFFCRLLAEELRKRHKHLAQTIDEEYIHSIFHAAPLHDIGKVGVSDLILLKPFQLTDEEFNLMKNHVVIGVNTLKAVQVEYPNNTLVNMGIDIAQFHHEKWDGSGYPAGLTGEEIPLAGRIMALADVYDALRSERPYKEAFSHEKSVAIIVGDSGKHFDPMVVEAFQAVEGEFAQVYERLQEP